ncbi:unnamed protein product [Bursaphelenchus okinawaensis]|uniref:Uncharacterized protein n=1 Tax=Bursaphelenchus okinawaensis TaxID=465554 RepID=A0A811KGD4_9BILA|nr:unnamed protein product [Bursaphelenchus okinawaensis]CAG9103922.1 unnamed protein product [Bursaphelenchus okinawaensis]
MGKRKSFTNKEDSETATVVKKAKKFFEAKASEDEEKAEEVESDPVGEGLIFEEEEHHHHVFGYQSIGRLESVLSKWHSRRLLKYSTQCGGIILAFGKITLTSTQPIYSVHPYLHVDYKVQCLIFRANKNTKFQTKVESVNGANATSTFMDVPVIIEGVQEEDEVVKGFPVTVQFKRFSYDERTSIIKVKVAH